MFDFTPAINTAVIVGIVYLLNLLAIIAVIFIERRSPSATLAWVMVLALIPILGFIMYLILSQNFFTKRINELTEEENLFISENLERQKKEMIDDGFPFRNPSTNDWRHLVRLNQKYAKSFYTETNSVELFTDGNALMEKMIDECEKATKSIYVEFFIIKRDDVGLRLLDVLTRKAEEGVSVKLLVDSQGSNKINHRVLKKFRSSGGQIGYFFRSRITLLNSGIGLKLNYRNHRKIVVIDDEIGYTGGYNIGREYLGEKKKFGYWRDTHARITGDAVKELRARFVLDWRFTTREQMEILPENLNIEDQGSIGIQIVSSGPESPAQEIKRAFMRMITYAEKNIYIQSPYFVPDQSILESLKMAAQSGLDVRLMIPCKPDHPFVYWATYAYVGELLKNGARVWIYDEGFLHAKTMVVDGQVSTVGSSNFDNRSFSLDFETNAFIFDRQLSKNMEAIFEDDMNHGHELTYEMYKQRSTWIKIKESVSRLLTDIL